MSASELSKKGWGDSRLIQSMQYIVHNMHIHERILQLAIRMAFRLQCIGILTVFKCIETMMLKRTGMEHSALQTKRRSLLIAASLSG